MRRYRHHSMAILAGLMAVSTGPAWAAKVENLSYTLGTLRFVIPRIETTGGTMTDADLRAATDPGGTDTMSQRLGRLNAAAIAIPELRVESTKSWSQPLVTYRDIRLSTVGGGRIDTVSIGGAAADMTDPKGVRIKATYGAMLAHKLDLGLILRILTARRTDPAEPMQTVYEDFSADGMTMTSEDVDVTMGRISGGAAKARPFETSVAEIVELAQKADGAKPSKEDERKAFLLAADVLDNVELGQGEMRDLKFTMKKAQQGTFSMGRIALGGIAKAKFGEIAYEDMRIAMPDGRMSLGRLALRDLDLSRTMAALKEAARSGDMNLKDGDPRAATPTLGLLQVAGVDADFPDKDGKGNSPDGKRILMSLGRFELAMRNFIEGVPSAIFATVQNFSMPLPKQSKDPNLRQFTDLGLDKIDLTSGLDIAWNEATQEIGINDLSASMPGLGALKIKGRLGNATRDLFSSNMALVQASALGVVANSLDVQVDNAGGIEKAMALQAKRAGQSVQQVQQMLIAGAAIGIPAVLGDHPAARAIANAVTKFLAEPKNLLITARAPAGLGVADVVATSNPQDILQKLDLTAEANR